MVDIVGVGVWDLITTCGVCKKNECQTVEFDNNIFRLQSKALADNSECQLFGHYRVLILNFFYIH